MYMIQNRLGWPSPNIAKSNMTFTSLIINIEFSTGCILLNHLEWSLSWANPWTEGYQVRSDGSEPGDFEHIVTGGGRCVYSHKHQGSTEHPVYTRCRTQRHFCVNNKIKHSPIQSWKGFSSFIHLINNS